MRRVGGGRANGGRAIPVIAMTALLGTGVFDRPQGVEPVPGSPQSKCWWHDADGKTWEIPCNGAEPYEIGVPG